MSVCRACSGTGRVDDGAGQHRLPVPPMERAETMGRSCLICGDCPCSCGRFMLDRPTCKVSADSVLGRFRAAMDGNDYDEARMMAERLCELLVEMAREHKTACHLAEDANGRLVDVLDRISRPRLNLGHAQQYENHLESDPGPRCAERSPGSMQHRCRLLDGHPGKHSYDGME